MARSQFYGRLRGRSQTEATRLGTKDSGLRMVAASKTGAITVELWHRDGKDYFDIYVTDWGGSRFDNISLATGHFPKDKGNPVIQLDEPTVRAHVEREALKAMTKED